MQRKVGCVMLYVELMAYVFLTNEKLSVIACIRAKPVLSFLSNHKTGGPVLWSLKKLKTDRESLPIIRSTIEHKTQLATTSWQ